MTPDIQKLMAHYRMDKSTMIKMLDLYLSSTGDDYAVLTEAMQRKDVEEIKKIIHKLKSAYAYLLISEVVTLCDKLKKEADHSNSYSKLIPLLSEFRNAHQIVSTYIEQLRETNHAQNITDRRP